jgi:hypothetical protein
MALNTPRAAGVAAVVLALAASATASVRDATPASKGFKV